MSLVLVLLAVAVASAQDCKVSGKRCIDDEQCCGGCCIEGVCMDTYRDCYSVFNVCHEHICYGAESCMIYIPPQCPGCEPMPICKLL